MPRSEVAIHGAGPVGCALALALRLEGRGVTLVARDADGRAAAALRSAFRPIALSYASRLILERIGTWPLLSPTPIAAIHVSQVNGYGRTRLSAADAGVPALGYVIDYRTLAATLRAQIEDSSIRIDRECAQAGLNVHAEGAAAGADEKHYRQEAVLALVTTRPKACRAAHERFRDEGPIALLPFQDRYALVWAMAPERARVLVQCPQATFLEALGRAFGARAGSFESASERSSVALVLRTRASRIGERQAYIGNAAQTLHPVAGQGLNLGLRDAWNLARVVRGAPDPGEPRLLARYAALRRVDATLTIRMTDFLAGAFIEQDPLSRAARGAALAALDACAPLRSFFARRMIFGASALP